MFAQSLTAAAMALGLSVSDNDRLGGRNWFVRRSYPIGPNTRMNWVPANINRHTGQAHLHAREIARRDRQDGETALATTVVPNNDDIEQMILRALPANHGALVQIGKTRFSGVEAHTMYRDVDKALQRLRRRGVIQHERIGSLVIWSVVA